ncbi:hypothetical protein [Glycomyces paridis]|uniref:Uncharacterized protein n=1 Tax=Glycomyces paridis TaxID=2126555 RepID=A0A4S8P6V7_9ACTN|nr:hypothetical protein [Glycomyces paridis]THV24522.1 hypothetical protein E9998_21150 [Glycomyces paridis]
MPRPVPGPEALVRYIQTGDRESRISYRSLPDKERVAYRDMVNRVYAAALRQHFGDDPSSKEVDALIERVGTRHPQYGGGVKRVLRSYLDGGRNGGVSPRQVLTAQHLVIREIAKLHPEFRKRADQTVAKASGSKASSGDRADIAELYKAAAGDVEGDDPGGLRLRAAFEERMRAFEASRATESEVDMDIEFASTDAQSLATVTLGLDGFLRGLELRRGVERVGGRSIAASILQAWVAAEKQRWSHADEAGVHDSAPEPGSGSDRRDTFLSEAYSQSRLCRATVDRHGRLRSITFMRNALFEDGRHGLAAEVREAIKKAQAALEESL